MQRLDITAVRNRLRGSGRNPRMIARLVLGVLVVANLAAALIVLKPWAGSAEDLERRAADLRHQVRQKEIALDRLRGTVSKVETARTDGDRFMDGYLLSRRTVSSKLLSDLDQMARTASIRQREVTFGFEPVEGSDTLTKATIIANYEGTYADLMHFLNLLDRSPRLLIIDSLGATPQPQGMLLNITMKLNAFVREGGSAPTAELAQEEAAPEAAPVAQPAPPAPVRARGSSQPCSGASGAATGAATGACAASAASGSRTVSSTADATAPRAIFPAAHPRGTADAAGCGREPAMNIQIKGSGAQRKKIAILGGLALVLAYFLFFPSSDDDVPHPPARAAASASSTAPAAAFRLPAPETKPRSSLRRESQPARPEFKMSTGETRPDPTTIDPTLRLDLLAKVQSVTLAGGERNLFQFGAAPLPPTPEPKIIPHSQGASGRPGQPGVAADGQPAQASKPAPPPIPLKFYGYSSPASKGDKRAFFLDGEEIIVATEGQMIKNRYKVVRVGINSVVVEDVQFDNQQTLPLEEQPG